MLNEQDLYYILASSLRVIDQTDYEFRRQEGSNSKKRFEQKLFN